MTDFYSKFISSFKRRGLVGNILTLVAGTTVAHAISVLISPILTRLFSPEEFGEFALYMSIVSVSSVVVTGRYELAIILPKCEKDALRIMMLSLILTFFISIILLVCLIVFYPAITSTLNVQDGRLLLFAVISVFLNGVYQNFYYWSNRQCSYKTMSSSKITQILGSSVVQVLGGIAGFGVVSFISGNILGLILSTKRLLRNFKKGENWFLELKLEKLKECAVRYVNFPKFLILAHFMNSLSHQVPVILFSSYYGVGVVGYLALVQRVLKIPLVMIGGAVGQVFRQRASREYIENKECKSSYLKTLFGLTAISLPGFSVLYFAAPSLIVFVFGEQWGDSAVYARYLLPMYFFQFISSPLSSMYMIAEKQKHDIFLQTLILIGTAISISLGNKFGADIDSIMYYSLFSSLVYIGNLFVTYNFSLGKKD